jgi:DNA-binding transcriptional LysR family regulator
VTRAIDALEQQLGIPLFKRSTRQLVLTEQGAYFSPAPCPAGGGGSAAQSLQPLRWRQRGRCGSRCSRASASCWLPRLPDFLARYPGVRLGGCAGQPHGGSRCRERGRGGAHRQARRQQPPYRHLLTNRSLLVASPAYLARHGEPAHPAELAHHNCLIRGHGRQRQHWYFQQGTEREKVAVQGNLPRSGARRCSAPPSRVRRAAAVELDGAAKHRRGHPAAAAARVARLPYEDRQDEIHAVFRGGRFLKPQTRAFIDFLVEAIRPCKGRADRNRPPGETLKCRRRAQGPASENDATATAQRDFRPSGLGESLVIPVGEDVAQALGHGSGWSGRRPASPRCRPAGPGCARAPAHGAGSGSPGPQARRHRARFTTTARREPDLEQGAAPQRHQPPDQGYRHQQRQPGHCVFLPSTRCSPV